LAFSFALPGQEMPSAQKIVRIVFMSDAYELREEAKALMKKDDGAPGIVVGNQVLEELTFCDDEAKKVIKFTTRQYRFLNAYKLHIPLAEAAHKAGMTPEQAERFLSTPNAIAWLQDMALKNHIKHEWEEPGKWYAVGEEYRNTNFVPKHKIDVWKEFGDRVCPKVSRNAEQNGNTSITININPEALEKSKVRRATIEAEIVKEQAQ
jgi:hypothetical protein